MAARRTVLCVLSIEQQEEYRAELESLRQFDVELAMRESGEQALEEFGELSPVSVVVGMEIGGMEGLEFVALLMNRHPDYAGKVVVLPGRDDPFPPVLQQRNPVTGKSTTEQVELAEVATILLETTRGEPTTDAPPPLATVAPTSRPRPWLWPLLGLAGLAAVAAVVLATRAGDRGARPEARPSPGTAPAPVADRTPADAAAAHSEREAADTDATRADSFADLREPVTLPVSFTRGGATPTVTDPAELQRIAARVVRALEADATVWLEIGGHTSIDGAPEANHELGRRRGEAVRDLLAEQGVPAARVVVKNYGPAAPATDNDTPAGRAQNRRVTVRLIN